MSIEDVALKLKTVSSTRTAAVIGITALLAIPFSMIAFGGSEASNLPWYVWVIVILAVALVVATGYYLFTRTHDGADISIRPK